MRRCLAELSKGISWTGDLYPDVMALLTHHNCAPTARHSTAVATQAGELAERFGADRASARAAGWLHDVSAIIPASQRLAVAREWGLEVLPAEEAAPMLLHQRLSAVIAADLFDITATDLLSAIGCHTTLKAQATRLDKVVLLADKIAWDQAGTPPYQDRLTQALDVSLDHAVFCYLDHLWQQRAKLAAVHPWFVDAYLELKASVFGRSSPSQISGH
jgi:predicted HD superfamily hydrolase involved in NAD metabolism